MADKVERRSRFEFGKNWQQFLAAIDEERIVEAERSLADVLGSLQGKRFLDIGSGSGLFSLAARRLGGRVHSFDFDVQSVACTRELRDRFFPDDPDWRVDEGSVLDGDFMRSLGTFDVVYSWGVLHHTGNMRAALERAGSAVGDDGQLLISIYNDQGGASRRWRALKRAYNRSSRPVKFFLVCSVGLWWESRSALIRAIRFQNPLPFQDWAAKKRTRGMSVWYDLVDWVGGLPFEVARPEEIFDFYRRQGFVLTHLTTVGAGHGCNEFGFARSTAPTASGWR